MGERALIQLIDKNRVTSPTLYLHWAGPRVANIISETQRRMAGRGDDIEYAFARLVQAAIGSDDGNTSYGVANLYRAITESDSPGDAGAFLVDISTTPWTVMTAGGYAFDYLEDDDEDLVTLTATKLPEEGVACDMTISRTLDSVIADALSEQALRLMREQRNESLAQQAAELMQLFADGLEILQPDDDDHAVLAAVLSDACRKAIAELAPTN